MENRSFEKELEQLINRYSIENGSNTPDFILAEYLKKCLTTFNETVNNREKWYGRSQRIASPIRPNTTIGLGYL